MRADADVFVEQALVLFDKAGMTIDELARKSNVNRTTLYRLFTGKRRYIDRSTAEKITKGLGAEIEFRRDKVRLYLPNKFKKTESFSQETSSIEVNDERPEPSPERVVDMLKDLDVEALEAANDLLRLFLSLDREDIELFKRMLDIISEEGNRGIFKQRLRALVSLVMPYSAQGATQQFE